MSSLFKIRVSRTVIAYMVTVLFVSMAIALFTPVCALFLADEVHASRFQIGMFFTVQGFFTIFLTQIIAKYSDVYGGRKMIIAWGCLCGSVSFLIFAYCRDYLLILLTGAFILSMSQIGAQFFASAREYCIYTKRNIYTFNSILRACFALAWVIGPPIALGFVGTYGFKSIFLATIAVYIIVVTLTFLALPNTNYEKPDSDNIRKIKLFSDRSVIFLCATTMCVFICNNMYMITMPQYTTHELGFDVGYVGIFVATAAGIEIPVMVISGQIAKRINMKYILLFGLFCGVAYNAVISHMTTVTGFLSAQVLNALFIGTFTSLGMLYFQELLPKIPGQATTLFTNSIAIGSIAAGAISGIISENFGFITVFNACVVVSFISFVCMSLVRKI